MKSVGIVMGSASDAPVMEGAVEALREFGVPLEVRVLSAHRTPDDALQFARDAEGRGFGVLIAGGRHGRPPRRCAGRGHHAARDRRPHRRRATSAGSTPLLAMVQMPPGVPVATVAVNGARNAGLLAVRILAVSDEGLAGEYVTFRENMAAKVRAADEGIRARYGEAGGSRPPTGPRSPGPAPRSGPGTAGRASSEPCARGPLVPDATGAGRPRRRRAGRRPRAAASHRRRDPW